MEASTATELVLGLLGGLALFIFGMRTMSDGLSAAIGESIRGIIARATRNRVSGIGLGGAIGFLIQSSASIVLFIGFINAGLMTFSQSIAPMLGANVGTTLSIQLISFKLSDYCLAGVFIGLLLHLVSQKPRVRNGGLALLGFGLLFLGMVIMGDAIRPHRELFKPWLALLQKDGHSLPSPTAGKTYPGKFLLRCGEDLHKNLAIHSAIHNESLNNCCNKLLQKDLLSDVLHA